MRTSLNDVSKRVYGIGLLVLILMAITLVAAGCGVSGG